MTDGNDPAQPGLIWGTGPAGDSTWIKSGGLTKRELFSALILAGACSNAKSFGQYRLELVREAVGLADMLIAALNKPQETI